MILSRVKGNSFPRIYKLSSETTMHVLVALVSKMVLTIYIALFLPEQMNNSEYLWYFCLLN